MKRDDSLKKHIFVPSTLPHQCVTTLSQTWKLGQHTVSTHHWCNQPIDGETWQVGQHFEIKNKVEYSIGWFCEKNNSITHSDNIILLDLLRKSFIMFYLLFWKKKNTFSVSVTKNAHSLFLSLCALKFSPTSRTHDLPLCVKGSLWDPGSMHNIYRNCVYDLERHNSLYSESLLPRSGRG